MAKRKEPDTPSKAQSTPTKRSKQQIPTDDGTSNTSTGDTATPAKSRKSLLNNGTITPDRSIHTQKALSEDSDYDQGEDGEATPKANGTTLFATPNKRHANSQLTPSRSTKADRSAKRKSTQALIEAQNEGEDWDSSAALAQAILDEAENIIQSTEQEKDKILVDAESAPVTPSKRSRGRPKGARNKRSPTPEGDLPPEERYFFQNRTGPTQVSANSFAHLGLLSHEEYFEAARNLVQNHELERAYLTKLHTRAFPQWKFELDEGFGICMYGYGSKRKLINSFAGWLYPRLGEASRIVVLNGYVERINIRSVLSTIGNALVGKDEEMKLVGQPHDMLDTILAYLTEHVDGSLVIMVNSIDSPSLRRTSSQSVLARLAAHSKVKFVASADTPTFPILWNSALKDQFRLLFHDCTTFVPYDVEVNPVDDVNELLGRKNRRVGGKEGVGFVLKSLPENARNLYRVLLTEILTVANDGLDEIGDEEEAEHEKNRHNGSHAEDVGIEYRALYQKASEEFICSSDMNFRFLLKEFHDHQMLTSQRDASGIEMLGVPLQKDEMEAILEDLVVG